MYTSVPGLGITATENKAGIEEGSMAVYVNTV